MRWNFNGLQARLSAAFLLVSVGIAAFVALAFRMDQATIERAARLEAEHVALTLVPPSLKDAIHKPALLQAFVDGAHSNYNRDVVIVDTRKVGIADIAHEELGQVY
ncbi:MAG TPA: hypothetical protein VH278_00590, partial [Burkholderiaceae bacterium]|nr:hypothetical protein [Burkholderiaceae bacterium]